MKKIFTLITLLMITVFAQSQNRYFKGILQGSQETTPTGSSGDGVIIVKYNMSSKFLELWGNYISLSGAPSGAHIHVAPPGANGGVLIVLTFNGTGNVGTLTGNGTLTAGQETDLLAGNFYVNVHTTLFGGGEVRAQLTTTTPGATEFLNARLQGAQEVPPNSSSGSGYLNVLIDTSNNEIYATGAYSGLVTSATAAHIHLGNPGLNGPVSKALIHNPATFGSLHVKAVLSETAADSVAFGLTYANIHNATFPGGELRGQITKFSQVGYFAGILQGSQEVPATASSGRGTVLAKYDFQTKILGITGDFQALTTAATAAHIHTAMAGSNGSVQFTLTPDLNTLGSFTNNLTLSPAQESDLIAGNMYVNIHTTTFPGGEIRAQLNPIAGTEVQCLSTTLFASQEVPATISAGTGKALVFLDKLTNKVWLSGVFSGLGSNITAAHIHQAPSGTNGSVILALTIDGTTSGTITGNGTLTPTQTADMINGFTYVNIHTVGIPSGEIRGQLANLVLPVKLSYFNGYKSNNHISLVWESTEEINLGQYEIEQFNSENGNWLKKGTIFATGGSLAKKYTYSDLPFVYKGNHVQYRLKMVDKDGRFTYSPVILINFRANKTELLLLSNPVVNNELRFMLTGLNENKNVEISIFDYSGRKLIQSNSKAFGTNTIDVSGLSKGLYQLVTRVDEEVITKSFLK